MKFQLLSKTFIVLVSFISLILSQDVNLSLDCGNLDYDSSADIAGFQFSHNGCVTGAGGGDATLKVDFIHGNSATLTVADANVNKGLILLPPDLTW